MSKEVSNLSKIYKYDTRYIVEFNDKTRASYSKLRYGPLLEKVTQLALEEDHKIWNYYEIQDNVCHIYYYDQKENKIVDILIDEEDQSLVYQYYIQLNGNGYAQTRTRGTKQYVHHLVMQTTEMTDHINCIRTDNRKCNLRVTTPSLNMLNKLHFSRNTSGVIGIGWAKKEQKWRARITFQGQEKTRYFDSFELAAECRKNWEEEIYKQNY